MLSYGPAMSWQWWPTQGCTLPSSICRHNHCAWFQINQEVVLSSPLAGLREARHCSTLQSEEVIFLKCPTLWNLNSQGTPVCFESFLVSENAEISLLLRHSKSVVCFLNHVSGFWMTEESLRPPGCNCHNTSAFRGACLR